MVTKMVHKIFIPMLIVISYLALKFVSFILTSCCVHTLHFTSERQNIKACNCSKCPKFPSFPIVDHTHKRRNFCRRPSYQSGHPMQTETCFVAPALSVFLSQRCELKFGENQNKRTRGARATPLPLARKEAMRVWAKRRHPWMQAVHRRHSRGKCKQLAHMHAFDMQSQLKQSRNGKH